MAAQEYYMGTQSAAELPPGGRPNLYQPQQAQQPMFQRPPTQPYPSNNYNSSGYAPTPPPAYSSYPLQTPPNQQLGVHSLQPNMAPYPSNTPAPQQFPTQPPKNGHLGAPLQPIRSHSQPARVHFAEQESDKSTDDSSGSDSEGSRRRRHHRHHGHNHSRRRDYESDSDYSDKEREKDRDYRRKSQGRGHRDKDTFLGAGAGAIIGDSLFPGLGTAAGLLLGGYGGRKYADRSRSEEPSHRHRHHSGYRNEKY